MGKTFDKKELPLLLCGFSTNFRKEGGAHGKYTKGLFRTHQFNKVEQFVFCMPEDDEKFFQLLQKNSEELYQQLEIPYRVVKNCAGDNPLKNAKMWDIEAFMADGKYREVGSCSTCTNYQAETLGIRFTDGQRKGYVHTLNDTALATSRTMVALVENHQQKDGSISIPKALWPYTGFKEIRRK
jgi:seryl-tRNA synthetase